MKHVDSDQLAHEEDLNCSESVGERNSSSPTPSSSSSIYISASSDVHSDSASHSPPSPSSFSSPPPLTSASIEDSPSPQTSSVPSPKSPPSPINTSLSFSASSPPTSPIIADFPSSAASSPNESPSRSVPVHSPNPSTCSSLFSSSGSRVFKSSKYTPSAPPAAVSVGRRSSAGKRPQLPKTLLDRHANGAIDLAHNLHTAALHSTSAWVRDAAMGSDAGSMGSAPPSPSASMGPTYYMPRVSSRESVSPPGSMTDDSQRQNHSYRFPLNPPSLSGPVAGSSKLSIDDSTALPHSPFSTTHIAPSSSGSAAARVVGEHSRSQSLAAGTAPPAKSSASPVASAPNTASPSGVSSASSSSTLASTSPPVSRRRRNHQYTLSLSELMETAEPRHKMAPAVSSPRASISKGSGLRPGNASPKLTEETESTLAEDGLSKGSPLNPLKNAKSAHDDVPYPRNNPASDADSEDYFCAKHKLKTPTSSVRRYKKHGQTQQVPIEGL